MVTAQKWLESAVKTIQALAINECLQIDGYEIGEGRKSYEWANEQEAFNKIMQLCIDMKKETVDIMEPAHLKSKSDVEKIIGKSKAARDLIDELIVEIPGNKILKRIGNK
jgi:predicted CopG family antitoxin